MSDAPAVPLTGAVPSPNIWQHTATYEIENHAADPDGRLWAAMAASGVVARPPRARPRLRLRLPPAALRRGRGDGDRRRAASAAWCALAQRRTRALPTVDVRPGTAQAMPLPDASVDVVHVRWAYFFGPGCEPGLAELDRVVRRGGTALVIDNDGSRSTFGSWFRRGYPRPARPGGDRTVLGARGWTRTPVDMGWRFESRADLESVVRIEFKPEVADAGAGRPRGHRGRLRRQPLVEGLLNQRPSGSTRRGERRRGAVDLVERERPAWNVLHRSSNTNAASLSRR